MKPNKITDELIYGIHAVQAVLQNAPHRILQLLVQQERHDQRLEKLLNEAQKCCIKAQLTAKQKLDALLPDIVHQGVVAKCKPSQRYAEDDIEKLLADLSEPAFILILDGVQDPHNLGACLRSANAAGVHFVIAPRDHSVGITPVVRKVASGATELTPFIQVTNLARTLKLLRDSGIWIYGLDDEAQSTLFETNLKGPLALVLGAEGPGLRRLTRENCDNILSIPMHGSVSSLNVSVATGVCLFEANRQRKFSTNHA